MPGEPPPPAERHRAALRFAFGTFLVFAAAQLLAWPIAYPAPVFCAVILSGGSFSMGQGLRLLIGGAIGLLVGLAIVVLLEPYPVVAALALWLGLLGIFLYILRGGVLLIGIFFLVGVLVLPVAGQVSPAAAAVAAGGAWTGQLVAVIISWLVCALLPPPPSASVPAGLRASSPELSTRALAMTLVLLPITLAHLVLGWGTILVLIYAGLMTLGAGTAAGWKAGRKMIGANLFGGIGAIIAYELVVAAPALGFALALTLAACLLFGERTFSGTPSAGVWSSAFNGFAILFGGALLSSGSDLDLKAIDRLLQIMVATGWVVFAYALIDTIRALSGLIAAPLAARRRGLGSG